MTVKSQPKITKKAEAAEVQVLVSTVQWVLHHNELRGSCPCRKSLIQTQDLETQLKSTADHPNQENTFWRNITFLLSNTEVGLLCCRGTYFMDSKRNNEEGRSQNSSGNPEVVSMTVGSQLCVPSGT